MNAEVLKKKLGLQGKKISDLPTTHLTDSTEVEVSNYGVSGKVAFGFIKELFTTKGMYIHQELYSTIKGAIEAIPEDKITLGMKVRFHSDKDTWEEYEYTGKNLRSIRNSDYWRKTENTEKVFEYIKEAVSKFEDKHSLCCISYKPSKIKVTCDVKKDSGCGCAKPFRIGDSIYIINEDGETEWLYDIIDTPKEEPKAPNKYRVTITYNDFGYYTNTLLNDTAEFEEGTVLRFDASPKKGFRVKNILVDGEPFPAKELVIFTLMKDTTIHFEYEAIPVEVKRYTVYTTAEQGGTVDKSETKVTFQDTFTAKATPDSTHTFVRWKDVKGTTISTSTTLTLNSINSDRCYIAEFKVKEETPKEPEKRKFRIVVDHTEGGEVSNYPREVEEGTSVTLSASARNTHIFKGWRKGNTIVSTNAIYVFTPTEDTTLTAVFEMKPPFNIIVTTEGGGTVGDYPRTAQRGTRVTFTATPNANHRFLGWYKGGSMVSSDSSYTITISEDLTLVARFEEVPQVPEEPKFTPVTFTAISSNERMGTVDKYLVTINSATETGTFTATPKNYYRFVQWVNKDNGAIVSTNSTITVAYGNILHYEAVFAPNYTSIFDEDNGQHVSGTSVEITNRCYLDGTGGEFTETVYAKQGLPFKNIVTQSGVRAILSEDRMSATLTFSCMTLKGNHPRIEITNIDDKTGIVGLEMFKEPSYDGLVFTPVEDVTIDPDSKTITINSRCTVGVINPVTNIYEVRIPYTGDLKEIKAEVYEGVTIRKEDGMVIITYICKFLKNIAHTIGKIFGFNDGDEWTVNFSDKKPAPKEYNLEIISPYGATYYVNGSTYTERRIFTFKEGTIVYFSTFVYDVEPDTERVDGGNSEETITMTENKTIELRRIYRKPKHTVTVNIGKGISGYEFNHSPNLESKSFTVQEGDEIFIRPVALEGYITPSIIRQTINEDTVITLTAEKNPDSTIIVTTEGEGTVDIGPYVEEDTRTPEMKKLDAIINNKAISVYKMDGPTAYHVLGGSEGGYTTHYYKFRKFPGAENNRPFIYVLGLDSFDTPDIEWIEFYRPDGTSFRSENRLFRMEMSKNTPMKISDPDGKLYYDTIDTWYAPYDLTAIEYNLQREVEGDIHKDLIYSDNAYRVEIYNEDVAPRNWMLQFMEDFGTSEVVEDSAYDIRVKFKGIEGVAEKTAVKIFSQGRIIPGGLVEEINNGGVFFQAIPQNADNTSVGYIPHLIIK